MKRDEQDREAVGENRQEQDEQGAIERAEGQPSPDRRRFLKTGAAVATGAVAAYAAPEVAMATARDELSPGTVVAIGMVYDQDDTVGPATILDLFIDDNDDVIAPDDVITVYRGIGVANGYELDAAIMSLEDVSPEEPVPLTIRPGGVGDPVVVFAIAKSAVGGSKTTQFEDAECGGNGKCDDGSYDCTHTRTWEKDPNKPKKFRHRWNCSDTGGNAFTGIWYSGK